MASRHSLMESTNNYLSYEQTSCCPLCGSTHFSVGVERKEIAQAIPMPAEQIDQQSVGKFTPALCEHCGISFNVSGLSNQAYEQICHNYQFIQPSTGVGAGNYTTFIQELTKHLASSLDKVLDIGGFDGFLMRQLQQLGYRDLTLIDPSAKTEGLSTEIKAIKGFFPQDDAVYQKRIKGESVELYDVIGSKDVVQMIPDLNGFFKGLNAVLKLDGIAVCASVPLDQMHVLQRSHLGINAYKYLAQHFGFELIDSYHKKENSYVVYVLQKKLDLLSASAQEQEAFINSHQIAPELFKQEQDKQRQLLSQKGTLSKPIAEKLNQFLAHYDQEVVIYGTGFYTFGILDALECDYHQLKLNLVNSCREQEGYLYMLPDSSTKSVHYADNFLYNRYIPTIILGVASPIFKAEIAQKLQDLHCTYDHLIYLPEL